MPSIILSDNGVSSGSAGLKTTAASDGALALQTTTSGGTATTAVTLDTNQNMGVGITSIPNYSANLRTVSFNNTSGVVHDYCVGGTRTGSLVCQSTGFDLTTQTSIPLVLSTNATERMRINAGAPILCLAGGNTSATGTGIAFPATQSASSDANTLDDYEEGTWTPVASSTGGVTGGTYSVQFGRYTKVGNLVTCQFIISLTTAGTYGNTTYMISGLPFTTSGTAANAGAGSAGYVSGSATAINSVFLNVESSQNYVYTNALTSTTTGISNVKIFGNGSDMRGTITYFT